VTNEVLKCAGEPQREPHGRSHASCSHCLLRYLCLADDLADEHLSALEEIVAEREPLDKGESLFRIGDPFRDFFVVRTGTFKSFHLSSDGDEQVTSFSLPGELIGLDAMADGRHPTASMALERSTVCAISMDSFEKLATRAPGLTHQFTRMVGKFIVGEQDLLMMRSRDTAEERVALFLLGFSKRLRARGLNGTEFDLSMPRRDLGKFLSLAVETVSRTLTKFRRAGHIEVDRRRVLLRDVDELRRIGRP